MLLTSFRKEIFLAKCNPSFGSLHCHAHLDQDVSEVIPFLNAELGGDTFVNDPPSVTLKAHGKLITVHARQIAVNALKDEDEADRILNWLKNEINQVWENRANIQPKFTGKSRPQVFAMLKILPKTNCRRCGQATCMVFAARLAEGSFGPEDCPELGPESLEVLSAYLEEHPPET